MIRTSVKIKSAFVQLIDDSNDPRSGLFWEHFKTVPKEMFYGIS